MTSTSLETPEKKSSSESMPVMGVGGAALEGLTGGFGAVAVEKDAEAGAGAGADADVDADANAGVETDVDADTCRW